MRLPKFFCRRSHRFNGGWGGYSEYKGSQREIDGTPILWELWCFRCSRYILVDQETYDKYLGEKDW